MRRAEQYVLPPTAYIQVSATTVSVEYTKACRGVLIETAGTLNVTMGGVARTGVPFPAGLTPGMFESIQTGGTASNVWAAE